jgi:hypothetical protein
MQAKDKEIVASSNGKIRRQTYLSIKLVEIHKNQTIFS